MRLNFLGKIIQNEWLKSADIRSEILLDEFVVMPNHFHGILFIRREQDFTNMNISRSSKKLTNHSLGAFVAGFKSAVTRSFKKIYDKPVHIWQRNYHEHIIRNEISLTKIREYVICNPQTWKKDALFTN